MKKKKLEALPEPFFPEEPQERGRLLLVEEGTKNVKNLAPMGKLLEDELSMDVQSENQVKTVSKELFNKQDIDLKTEVTHNEINNITRLRFLEDKYGITNVDALLQSFLSLRVSKARKSRREFIEALQTETRNEQGGNWFQRMLGRGGNP